jgi:hypothetical protein
MILIIPHTSSSNEHLVIGRGLARNRAGFFAKSARPGGYSHFSIDGMGGQHQNEITI